jgi:hypothetical protein
MFSSYKGTYKLKLYFIFMQALKKKTWIILEASVNAEVIAWSRIILELNSCC